MDTNKQEEQSFDIIVAGAGITGILAANRLCQSLPDAKVLLLDKASRPGGRALSPNNEDNWGYGLNFISEKVLNFIEHSYSLEPELSMPESAYERKLATGTILAAGKFQDIVLDDCFNAKGAKVLAGNAAVKEWPKIESVLGSRQEPPKNEVSFAKAWRDGKKNPAVIALHHLSTFCGMADIWKSSPQAIQERLQYFESGLYSGPWEDLLSQLLSFPSLEGRLSSEFSCRIIEAAYEDKSWRILTEKGTFKGKAMLVAQSPWQAMEWLDRGDLPIPVLQLALKSKPTSVVTLSTKHEPCANLPDLVYIPAEEVQVLRVSDTGLCYQATIDFETTLNAPAVVKAIKRLKRARKKLEAAREDLKSTREHIALVPIAWSHSAYLSERKIVQKLGQESHFQSAKLGFCGDSYGDDYSPDVNLVRSLSTACTAISDVMN
ncbi:MAG: NAD(P)-binding protein [Oligoflexales bacterium]